jgi:hypothetical protein
VVDPGLLSNLVETAIDWAMDNSVHVAVNLAISAWPEHGLLSIAATRRADPPEPGRNGTASASLRWHLLSQIARTMGVILSATNQGIDTTLRLEFARTVKHLEGLTSMEIESSSSDSALHTGTKALAGLRILLISTDAAVRGEVEKACRALGLRADTVATSAKAVRYTERDQPHMIIVDERLRDNEFDALMQDIRRLDPQFRLPRSHGRRGHFRSRQLGRRQHDPGQPQRAARPTAGRADAGTGQGVLSLRSGASGSCTAGRAGTTGARRPAGLSFCGEIVPIPAPNGHKTLSFQE